MISAACSAGASLPVCGRSAACCPVSAAGGACSGEAPSGAATRDAGRCRSSSGCNLPSSSGCDKRIGSYWIRTLPTRALVLTDTTPGCTCRRRCRPSRPAGERRRAPRRRIRPGILDARRWFITPMRKAFQRIPHSRACDEARDRFSDLSGTGHREAGQPDARSKTGRMKRSPHPPRSAGTALPIHRQGPSVDRPDAQKQDMPVTSCRPSSCGTRRGGAAWPRPG